MAAALLTALVLFLVPALAGPGAKSLADEESDKVMCTYLVYGSSRYICGEPPLSEVKKKCDEKASEERGEKAECDCTQDPNYIQDACG